MSEQRSAGSGRAPDADGQPYFGAFVRPTEEITAEVQALYDEDQAQYGFVMNASRVWSHAVGAHDGLFDLLKLSVQSGALSLRERGILVSSCASELGDAYCSLAWGTKLADQAGAEVAGDVLRGRLDGLSEKERALAGWARRITADPNGTTAQDVQSLRDVGYDDAQIVAITVFVALRIAFSTVNDALGARPDRELFDRAPAAVSGAVDFGRPIAEAVEPS